MFNTGRYQPYEAVRNGDSSDEHEHEHEHENDTRDTIPSTKITDLLKLTAHRRIRTHNNQSNSNTATSESVSIPINETPMPAVSASEPGVSDLRDIDLEDTHRDSPNNASEHDNDNDNDSEGEGSHTVYDDHVWLLHLDGNKRKIGVCHTWSILDLKRKYFAVELKNGAKIRLIHRGKLLMDSMAWQSYDIATDAFIHVSITKNAFASKTNGGGGDGMHVHDRNYDEFDDGLDDAAVARRLQMELNRAELGASDDRLNYNAWNGMGMGMPQDPQQRESDLTRARREFFCGVLLGSIMGFWSLIFLLMAYRNQYSRRFRLGVSVGVAMNFMLGLMYQVPNHNAAHNSSSDGSSGEDGSVSGHLSDGQQVSETAGAT